MIFSGRSFSGLERHCAFLNVGDVQGKAPRFASISAISGLDLPDDGRAVASVDWDQDGDLDLWITNRNAPRLRFFRNDQPQTNRFIALHLEGNGKTTSRDAIGARVEIHLDQPDHKPLIKTLRAGEGFIGQSSKWLHFGLGDAGKIQKVIVRWPAGEAESFANLKTNTRYHLVQGSGSAETSPPKPRKLKITPGAPEISSASDLARIPLAYRLPMIRVPYTTPAGSTRWARFDQGKPVLLSLWASWCLPCLGELTEFTARSKDLQDAGLEILAISVDGMGDDSSPAAARKRAATIGFPFEIGHATPQLLSSVEIMHHRQIPMRLQLPLPTSFLIDKNGQLAAIYKGPVAVDTLIADLKTLEGGIDQRFLTTAAFPGRLIDHPKIRLARRRTETLIRFRLATNLESNQRFEEAAIHYQGIVEMSPEYAEAHNNLGNVLDRLQQFATAEEHLREAIRLNPTFAFAHHNLGNALLHQGSAFTSLSSYRKALDLDPTRAGFYFSYANALLAAGEPPARAIKNLEKAIALDARFESAHLLHGYVHQKLGNKNKAIASYLTVLEINPENETAKQQLAALK